MTNTFLYFAYGSNLLAKRIHMNNPTAVLKCIAKLENYRLDFGWHSKKWGGAVATIVPDKGEHVWGAVWELNLSDMSNLDKQEAVSSGIYEAVHVDVKTIHDKIITCRCYQLTQPPDKIPTGEPVPENRQPSGAYFNVILDGAIECKLPEDYIAKLRKIVHNNCFFTEIDKIMLSTDEN